MSVKLEVAGPRGAYSIHIERGLLQHLDDRLARDFPDRGPAFIVTQRRVWSYVSQYIKCPESVHLVFLPEGESAKSLETVADVYRNLLSHQCHRQSLILAVGGGVVGDIAGFAAATFMRGVDYVQVPTTLLAMVDSAIGGKTGVDFAGGKNIIGAFHTPQAVLVDSMVVDGAGPEAVQGGLAETVKHAIIGDPELFDRLKSASWNAGCDFDELIRSSVKVKADIVSTDPLERGVRAHLNLGHTFGHGIEAASSFEIPHGDAVAMGLVAAARLGAQIGVASPDLEKRISDVLQKLDLPTNIPDGLDRRLITSVWQHDKKRTTEGLRFILPQAIGNVGAFIVSPETAVLAL